MRIIQIIVLLISFTSFSQENTAIDSIIDGVNISEVSCKIDTLISIFHQKKLIKESINYQLVDGQNSYFEIHIFTHDCHCRDCEYSVKIIVEIESNKSSQIINLDTFNTSYYYWNVWRYESEIKKFKGYLKLDTNCLEFQIAEMLRAKKEDFSYNIIHVKR
ncbi:MAG: hypothetical protein HYR91_02280 [Flavobacteriia bacterium]|nr:hypothetical protein [Flavobacteriia bacterium]